MNGEADISLIALEAAVFLLGIVMLALDMMFRGSRPAVVHRTAIAGAVLLVVMSFIFKSTGGGWYGMILVDSVTIYFRRIFLVAAALVFIMMSRSTELRGRDPSEYYALALFATVGMMFTAAANNFMTLFMALELLTISFYILVAYNLDDLLGLEAGVKYLIIGTVSTAFILLGVAFVYGTTGSLDFGVVTSKLATAGRTDPLLLVGTVLILIGLGFKISAVPFHSWAPDVYQGAPTPVVAFLSVGSKAAGFVLLMRLAFAVFLPIRTEWVLVMSLVTVATLFYGNLGALPQTNIKRLLGYSSIAQAGYLLLGLVAATVDSGAAMMYYLAGYLVTNLLAFLVIVVFERVARGHSITNYSGLARRSPILAASLLVAMLSLAGVPPLAGFFGKFLLIDAIIKAGYTWLAIVAALNVVTALYYYLQVVKTVYVLKPASATPLEVSVPMKAVLYASMLAILFIGIFQEPLYQAVRRAAMSLFR
jgi:NADH-quinone oxidoreductase subunit N